MIHHSTVGSLVYALERVCDGDEVVAWRDPFHNDVYICVARNYKIHLDPALYTREDTVVEELRSWVESYRMFRGRIENVNLL